MLVQSTLALLSLALILGASGAKWSMNYTQQEICAVKGSTVFINGSYTLPEHLTVIKSFWAINSVANVEPNDLSTDLNYSGRVEYLVDKQKNFALKLSNVTKKDEHLYCFRIIASQPDQKWIGQPGVILKVTELHVESPGEVTEGKSAVLTCKTTCSLTDPTFIWYKDGRPLTTKMIQKNQQLHLQTVSSEDAGSYSCAVRGSEHLPSTAQTLRVRHPPKNVSVSISPSGGIVEGSSVNLTCSSDGDPPVENYTWFKDGGESPVGSGHSYIPLQSGFYYCQAHNQHGAQRSAAVPVLIKGSSYVALHAGVGVGCVLLFFVIISFIFFIRFRNKRRRSRIKEESSMRTVYAAISPISAPRDAAEHTSEDQECLYANVLQVRTEEHPRKTYFSGAAMEEKLQEDELLYAKVTFHSSAPPNRYDEDMVEDPSALYSTVQRKV